MNADPWWRDALERVGGAINPDGTIDLFHGTRPERAEEIVTNCELRPIDPKEPVYVYFSARPAAAGAQFGGAVVSVQVNVEDITECNRERWPERPEDDDDYGFVRCEFEIHPGSDGAYRPVSVSLHTAHDP